MERLRQQCGPVVLATLAGGEAGVHREPDDVASWRRGIGMLFEGWAEAICLTDGDRAIRFGDDQAKPSVADTGQCVDAAGLGADHADELAQDAPETALDVLAGADLISLDLEHHDAQSAAEAFRRAHCSIPTVSCTPA